MTTVKETLDAMPSKLIKSAAAGVTGEGGGKWHAEVRDCERTVTEG